ncbi:hypothetical protein GW17_00041473 [Ensete ventricosum]|nr:hypothetical protein GW17_00041473 [Ensete ventricosum]
MVNRARWGSWTLAPSNRKWATSANSLTTVGAAHEERDSEQDEHEIWYFPQVEEASSGAPIGKKSHKERLIMAETRLDVLEARLEELYQGQQKLLGVKSSQEEAKS